MNRIPYVIILLLAGCTTQTPTETIVNEAIKNVDETIDYADNNIVETQDTAFLLNGLKSCRASLVSCGQSYKAEIQSEQNNTAFWKLATGALAGVIGALLYLLFKRK